MSLSMNEFAARPVHAASAVRGSFLVLGVIASLAAGKAMSAQAPMASAEPAAQTFAVTMQEPAKSVCRQVEVETDDGYGVRGHVARWVCHN